MIPGSSCIRACHVVETSSKEKQLFVWDDIQNCVQRMIINKDGRCQLTTIVIHSVSFENNRLRLQTDKLESR